MNTIQDWLKEEDTFLGYYIDGGIDWDVVSGKEIRRLLDWFFTGTDCAERIIDLMELHYGGYEYAEDLYGFIRGDLDAAVLFRTKVQDCALDQIKYLVDKEIDVCEEALREYSHVYAHDAAADSLLHEHEEG